MNVCAVRISFLVWWGARAPVPRERSRERGQGMVEYALILMLMALVVIVLLSIVGSETNNVFSNINNGLAV